MKNIIKKISAIAMCGVLTVGSVLMKIGRAHV